MKIRLIVLVLFILFVFNEQAKAQNESPFDTVFFDIPELRVNNNSFLYDLDTMFQKSYLCKIRDDGIFTIEIKQTNEDIYSFIIKQTPLDSKRGPYARGFFMINGIYLFVRGTKLLSEYPEGFFTVTNNQQSFYYLKLKPNLLDFGYVDGECWRYLEYRDGKLFFSRKWK